MQHPYPAFLYYLLFSLSIASFVQAQSPASPDKPKPARGLFPGYIVKYNNDTLRGYIRSPGSQERFRRVDFVGADGVEQKKLTAEDIRAYGYLRDTMHRFIKVEVPSSEKEAQFYELFGLQVYAHKSAALYRHELLTPTQFPSVRNYNKGKFTSLFFLKKPGKAALLLGSELIASQINAYLGTCDAFAKKYHNGVEYGEAAIIRAIMFHLEACKK